MRCIHLAYRVLRGGSYYCDLSHALSTYRIGYSPNEYGDQLGFRIALNTPN